ITGIASVIECLDETANDTNLRLCLAKKQHTAVARKGTAVEISLKGFTAKSCKRQYDLRILSHGGFLEVVALSVLSIAILKQWLAQGNRYFVNNPGKIFSLFSSSLFSFKIAPRSIERGASIEPYTTQIKFVSYVILHKLRFY